MILFDLGKPVRITCDICGRWYDTNDNYQIGLAEKAWWEFKSSGFIHLTMNGAYKTDKDFCNNCAKKHLRKLIDL